MIRLSVIMPTHNRAGILRDTLIQCARAGAGLPLEFVVIDDGSRDETPSLLQEMARSMPALRWRSVPNGGPGKARNHGADLAGGELVMFMGDDIRPQGPGFFQAHLEAHTRYPEPSVAVMGKVVWPDSPEKPVNLVMSQIQGPGAQQFGYYYLKPYSWLDWTLFWTANVSVKRALVSDWPAAGFDRRFRFAAWEDVEFSYRTWKADDQFRILYVPRSVGAHHHHYNLKGFLDRQVTAGLALKTFVDLHPEIAERFAVAAYIAHELRRPKPESENGSLLPDYAAVVEGIKSYGIIHDSIQNIGTKNWHATYLNALFQLAFEQGVVASCDDPGANLACAYRGMIQRFVDTMSASLETEVLGQHMQAFNPLSIRAYVGPPPPPSPPAGLFRRVARRVPLARLAYRVLKSQLRGSR